MSAADDTIKILLAGESLFGLGTERSILSLHNPEFLFTNDGLEALELVSRHRPRLGIFSTVLPGLPGEKVVKEIRKDPVLCKMSIILIDPSGDTVRRGTAANVGIDCARELDREAVVMIADRLLSISPRRRARAAICLGHKSPGGISAAFATSLDISESGMLIECDEEIPKGEEVSLHFVLPGMPDLITAKAKVIRATPTSGKGSARKRSYGLEFTTLLPSQQLKIRRFLRDSSGGS